MKCSHLIVLFYLDKSRRGRKWGGHGWVGVTHPLKVSLRQDLIPVVIVINCVTGCILLTASVCARKPVLTRLRARILVSDVSVLLPAVTGPGLPDTRSSVLVLELWAGGAVIRYKVSFHQYLHDTICVRLHS